MERRRKHLMRYWTILLLSLFVALLAIELVAGVSGPLLALGYSALALALLPLSARMRLPVFAVASAVILLHSVSVADEWRPYMIVFNIFLGLATVFLHRLLVQTRSSQLERSEAQLEALWNSIVEGLVVIDAKGNIASVNPAAERIFGYDEYELLDRNVKILMPDRYATGHDGYISAYRTTGDAKIIGIGREVAGRRKDGTEFPLYLAVNEFKVDGETFFGGILRDMTVEEAVRCELVAAKEAAEDANRAKTVFLSSISHEVRTPLNAILGFAQLMDFGDRKELSDKQREYLGHITKSGENLLSLINQVLDLAQLECGEIHLSVEGVAVQSVLHETLDLLAPLAAQYEVSLEPLRGMTDEQAVRADRVRFQQALHNIISNAIKYNRRGGTVGFEISEPLPGILRTCVIDTGGGIPEDRWDQLFEPFNRLGREASVIEGSGIGLTVSRTVIEAMGGKIGLSSELGKGTRFWIDLPIVKEKTRRGTPEDAVTEMKVQRRMAPARRGLSTILYIEDNPANTDLMQQFLGDIAGLNLITVLTAEDGIAVARDRKVDLILMDLNLPGMDGFEAQFALSADEKTRNIPVIAVSADVNSKTIQRAMNSGFRRFITKPFNLKEAHQAIISVLPPPDERP
jgi:PAS domain S-box-containing protein